MNLDDLANIHAIDAQGLLADLDTWPEQVSLAWTLAQSLTLPSGLSDVQQVVMAGMGSSAEAGALARAYAAGTCRVPVAGLASADLPAWVGPQTLVIANSHSGNTEETLGASQAALARGARLVAITGSAAHGGRLAALAEQAGQTVWRFDEPRPAQSALGYAFVLTLGVLAKLGFIADPAAELAEAVAALRAQRSQLRAETPVAGNPAKRMAGQFMDRIPLICGAGRLAPVAVHWKSQINGMAKALAVCDELPEMGHNSVAGTLYPEQLVGKFLALFLRSSFEQARESRRAEITREIYMTAGFNTDTVEAAGPSSLAHMLTSLHYGDYVAFYLAICYGVDPSLEPQIDYLKEQLGPPSAAA